MTVENAAFSLPLAVAFAIVLGPLFDGIVPGVALGVATGSAFGAGMSARSKGSDSRTPGPENPGRPGLPAGCPDTP
ncbi:hypothetical protein [Nocardiopsis lambiniae]|uniref:Glycine zipper family protein n=1 Tax=Nocardiopsis lambiniae TaxID=3075539 RepID=A0ABU2MCJ3_9ACTN|nr:hypothetical protein [Nocardiopsis sp. DSM 44743]MDT0330298.1 hypothetical protein [Nocardiopsis sp. DSM 44743]